MSELDDVLDELRDHSRPGRRAELVLRAWRAGGAVTVIAEAARVSRPTVYADLTAQGVDARTADREGETAMTATLTDLEIDGVTGTERDRRILEVLEEDMLHLRNVEKVSLDDPRFHDTIITILRKEALSGLLRDFRTAAPVLDAETAARATRDRALHQVQTRWESLSTAEHWHAAHHAWIVAHSQAGASITAWREAARAALPEACKIEAGLMNLAELKAKHGVVVDVPEQILAAAPEPGYSAAEIDATARRLTDRLDRDHADRQALAAQTLKAIGA